MFAVHLPEPEDMVQLLLENGADPKAKNSEGKTPLDLAIAENNTRAVALLSGLVAAAADEGSQL